MRIKVSEFRKVVFVVITVFVSNIIPVYCQEIQVDTAILDNQNYQTISTTMSETNISISSPTQHQTIYEKEKSLKDALLAVCDFVFLSQLKESSTSVLLS